VDLGIHGSVSAGFRRSVHLFKYWFSAVRQGRKRSRSPNHD
jgi:hypothetical protein